MSLIQTSAYKYKWKKKKNNKQVNRSRNMSMKNTDTWFLNCVMLVCVDIDLSIKWF